MTSFFGEFVGLIRDLVSKPNSVNRFDSIIRCGQVEKKQGISTFWAHVASLLQLPAIAPL